ncbi:ribonuclease Y [Candidatus Dependentiae bacterium]|nr:ribonuclease Y [Candidatus Dependentiae bacterium]
MVESIILLAGIGLIVVGAVVLFYAQKKNFQSQLILNQSEERAETARQMIENEKKEAYLRMKDELYKRRKEFEIELKRERLDLDQKREQLNEKYEALGKKEQRIDDIRHELQQKEREMLKMNDILRANEVKLKNLYEDLIMKLEQLSGMNREKAKETLLKTLEGEVVHGAEKWVQKIEEEARDTAKLKAAEITVSAMQRYTADDVPAATSGSVQLPNEDMKGRIIGKEGRNIKSLEMATGMEFVIDDSSEMITISGFNPIRREIAKRSLEKLIQDGRINPTRIEETVAKCESEIDDLIQEYGKKAVLEFNLQGIHPEIVTLLGKLFFRTSYSQNVLQHCKEVGLFARMIAEELGLDGNIALRAGLLHDIGKAVTAEVEGPHAQIGAEIAKRCGESDVVVNAIAAHHEEVPFASIYAPIVVIADTISASRPGARRETFAAYIKKLEKLEEIAYSFDGVKKAYALQAGREIRIIIQEDTLSDDDAKNLARDVAKTIEKEMNFPGQIKVNVIREKRVIEYAR